MLVNQAMMCSYACAMETELEIEEAVSPESPWCLVIVISTWYSIRP